MSRRRTTPTGPIEFRAAIPDAVHRSLVIRAVQERKHLRDLVVEILTASVSEPLNDNPQA